MLYRLTKQQTIPYGSCCIWLEARRPYSLQTFSGHRSPSAVLLQVGAKLRDAERISTTRGLAGGCDLKMPPKEISLFDIILIMEERPKSKPRSEYT